MKKKLIDEPVVLQIQDTLEMPWTVERYLNLKLGCDKLKAGLGEFGSITNPIPVNGVIGEVFYLNRLRTHGGEPVEYKRVCSKPGLVCGTMVDEYAIFSGSCHAVSVLYFDMYNLWRSAIAPRGFTLKPVSDFTGEEIESMKIVNPEMYT